MHHRIGWVPPPLGYPSPSGIPVSLLATSGSDTLVVSTEHVRFPSGYCRIIDRILYYIVNTFHKGYLLAKNLPSKCSPSYPFEHFFCRPTPENLCHSTQQKICHYTPEIILCNNWLTNNQQTSLKPSDV